MPIVVVLSLLLAACGGGNDGAGSANANVTPSPSLSIRAKALKFDKKVLATAAGSQVTLSLDNQDAGALHNVAIYRDAGAKEKVWAGELFTGRQSIEYHFRAPDEPGTYYFRCDAHPDMRGSFLVTESTGGVSGGAQP